MNIIKILTFGIFFSCLALAMEELPVETITAESLHLIREKLYLKVFDLEQELELCNKNNKYDQVYNQISDALNDLNENLQNRKKNINIWENELDIPYLNNDILNEINNIFITINSDLDLIRINIDRISSLIKRRNDIEEIEKIKKMKKVKNMRDIEEIDEINKLHLLRTAAAKDCGRNNTLNKNMIQGRKGPKS